MRAVYRLLGLTRRHGDTAVNTACDKALQDVHDGEHTGTRWGCPRHFHVDERAADQLEPNDLLLPAVRIDIRRQSAHNADYGLTVDDLTAWESEG